MRFKQEKVQGILIDAQEKLFPLMSGSDELENQINILLEGLNVLKTPIILSEQYTKGLGNTLPSIKNKLIDFKYGEKTHFSCADDETLLQHIITNQKSQIIIFGIEAHVCVLQTAIDLVEKGYEVCVVADAISSRTKDNKLIALERMKQEGVYVTSVESILLELCRNSKNEVFKQISALIK